jgi:hypothetical protein
MKYLLLFENFINEEKEGNGFSVIFYDEVQKHWGNSNNEIKNIKPDEVFVYVWDKHTFGILKGKMKSNKVKYNDTISQTKYNFIIKEKDVDILFSEPEKPIFNSFNITKKDIQRVLIAMKDGFDNSWTSTDSTDNCWWKVNHDYPNGFKNIPETIKLFRYLEVSDESKIRVQNLGVHYVTNKECIDSNFLDSIFGVGDGFIVEIETTKDQIDIYETIENNLYYPDENEITLKEDAKIKIVNIEKYKGGKSNR